MCGFLFFFIDLMQVNIETIVKGYKFISKMFCMHNFCLSKTYRSSWPYKKRKKELDGKRTRDGQKRPNRKDRDVDPGRFMPRS